MEAIRSEVLKFHHINQKKIESWLVEAVQLNEDLKLSDEEVFNVALNIAKEWEKRDLPLTHSHFHLAVKTKLEQLYASKIETKEYKRGCKTQEVVSNVKDETHKALEGQRSLDPLEFDVKEVEEKYELPYYQR